jgi:hypothetical protein
VAHGHGRYFYLVDPDAKGANQGGMVFHASDDRNSFDESTSVITILTEVLEDLRSTSKFKSTRRLLIQFDGSSENWNQSLLGWCHLLVAGRAFDEVSLYREFRILLSS